MDSSDASQFSPRQLRPILMQTLPLQKLIPTKFQLTYSSLRTSKQLLLSYAMIELQLGLQFHYVYS